MSINSSGLIKAYSQDPINQYTLEEYDTTFTQGNTICGDTITIYLKISSDKKIIEKYSHAGDPQMFTLAAASMLAEEIEGTSIEEVMKRGGTFMKELGLDVSPRRKRSTVSALLAVHNALYSFLGESRVETYEEILDY